MTGAGTGVLHVVATPIGNLEDITLRALRVLRECDAVVAEDTRRTRQLLTAHGISRPLHSLPAHAEQRRVPALVDTAGRRRRRWRCAATPAPRWSATPAPRWCTRRATPACTVVPVPGASALTTALAGSGLRGDRVCFLGFLPRSPGKLRRAVEAGPGRRGHRGLLRVPAAPGAHARR